jgi:hypothetical protein
LLAGENQTRDYYMNIGPQQSDAVSRALYAEISSVEEQHVTQYESIIDPAETMLEKWLLHELSEVHLYHSCAVSESNPRIKAIWERFMDYELGQLQLVMKLMREFTVTDPMELIPAELPEPLKFESNREYLRELVVAERDFRAQATEIGPFADTDVTQAYRRGLADGFIPSALPAGSYRHTPGGETARLAMNDAFQSEVSL